MKIGFVGLGKMGMNMVKRLIQGGHTVLVYDQNSALIQEATRSGGIGTASLKEMAASLAPPRAIWTMVPAGAPTQSTLDTLATLLGAGDLLIDGGNTHFQEDVLRARHLAGQGIHYIDVGTSGGVWGLKNGYCLMVGGAPDPVSSLTPIFTTLAPENGWAHVGGPGAGHYVKMVHNGIEYSLMQGYAEGFELMAQSGYALDLARISKLWMQGSVVRSWLLELTAGVLSRTPHLTQLSDTVEDSGEGRWMIEEALRQNIPTPALTAALFARFRSRQQNTYSGRLLTALRNAFGGHLPAGEKP